jgi:hypothetical protein
MIQPNPSRSSYLWRGLLLVLVMLLIGCFGGTPTQRAAGDGPPSAQEDSRRRPKLQDRIAFLEQYVTFRRTYLQLEYNVFYQNNGGSGILDIPGPSEWGITIVAVVPPADLPKWIPAGVQKRSYPPPAWVKNVPGNIVTTGVTEWYSSGSIEVGIDRKTATVVYQNSTF